MNRRLFLRSLVGGSAVALAPSLVWPFRKIFLPTIVTPFESWWYHSAKIYDEPYSMVQLANVQAVELEAFAKAIPNIIFANNSLYNYFKKDQVDIHWGNLEVPIQVKIV